MEAEIFIYKIGKVFFKIHGINFSNSLWKDAIIVQFGIALSQTLEMCDEYLCGSFGHRKLIAGPYKHEAIPFQIQLNAGTFYLFVCKK